MSARPTETLDSHSLTDSVPEDVSRDGLLRMFGPDPAVPIERRRLPPEGLTIGRDLPIFASGPLRDPRISRSHAQFSQSDGQWTVADLKSRNGVRVNGETILITPHQTPLSHGDVIRIGDTLMMFAPIAKPPKLDETFIGQSPAMTAALRSLSVVAPHRYAVLLLGETGTGKEVAARALHRLSRRTGRFVATNCAAFAEGVLESELFGHTKGAFTDASQSREGLFKLADGGTLFLDEIGDMPLGLQSRLLRVLESGSARPVGGSHEVHFDVRVVAATNRDLKGMIRKDTFRADLYARLTQWTLTLPPLRDRREDIPLLTRHLLKELGGADRTIAPDLAEALLLHPWSLNVRGLKNVLSTAVVASEGQRLEKGPEVSAALSAYRDLSEPSPEPEEEDVVYARASKRQPSAAALQASLKRNGGSVAAVARDLNASRQQVYRWLKGFQMDPTHYRD